jgi:hypothetical protein
MRIWRLFKEDTMNDSDKEKEMVLTKLELETEELKAKNFLKKCGYTVISGENWKRFQNHVWLCVAGLCITAFIMGFLLCKIIG